MRFIWRRCERSIFVPSFHVTMIIRISKVSSIVNQPPCMNFAIEAMKNMMSLDRNTIENTIAPTLCRLYHMYTVSSTVVLIIVMVSARP